MAATSNKPSPSNKEPVEASSEAAGVQNSAVSDKAAGSVKNAASKPSERPTYDSSEKSEYIVSAKALLSEGKFDDALALLEEGLQFTTDCLNAASEGEAGEENASPLHEALAPFHYMYGTTLLYSIEESDGQAMTVGGGVPGQAEGDDQAKQQEEAADDMEIAWENLDTARTTLDKMLGTSPHNSLSSSATEKLKLDLAQVHLREGDLQRLNGNYEAAVSDYLSCLKIREESSLLDPHNSKIADVRFNLALVYTMLVADAKAPEEGTAEDAAAFNKKVDYNREQSLLHFLACGQNMSARAALLCDLDPNEFLNKAEADIPKFKSTGDENEGSVDHPNVVGMKLRSFRKHVSMLQPDDDKKGGVAELSEMLDEIQENVDEAAASEKGVHEIHEMKADITAAVAGQDDGFDSVGNAEAATVGFGSSAAAASSAAARPLMVVKKKKKRPADEANQGDEGKLKRAKSE